MTYWCRVVMVVLFAEVPVVLSVIWFRNYFGAVVDLKKHKEYFHKTSPQLLAQLIEDARFANDHNEKILANKQQLFVWVISVFILGFILGITSLFISA